MFEIPIFPLNTVLFPGMPLRLHIFEDRYKQMMKRVLETNHTFGVCLIRRGEEALGPLAEPYPIGCTARVTQVERLPEGCMNLTVIGDERFQIIKSGLAEPYLNAFVEGLPLKSHHSLDVVRGAHLLRKRLARYLELLAQVQDLDDENGLNLDLTSLQLPEDPMMLMYLSAALLQVPAAEKQPMLEAETAAFLLEHIQRIYRRELALLPQILTTGDSGRASPWAN